jgi:hypothetical protein
MMRLILTTDSSGAGCLMQAGIADLVIPFGFCFVGGPLPPASDLAASLSTRSTKHETAFPHWLENAGKRHQDIRREGVGLIELCKRCETIELWVDPEPNAQLTLIWLLDYLQHHPKIALKLKLVQAPDRRSSAGRSCRMADTSREHPEPSFGNRQRGLAGLPGIDTAGLVRPVRQGSQRDAAASAERG